MLHAKRYVIFPIKEKKLTWLSNHDSSKKITSFFLTMLIYFTSFCLTLQQSY